MVLQLSLSCVSGLQTFECLHRRPRRQEAKAKHGNLLVTNISEVSAINADWCWCEGEMSVDRRDGGSGQSKLQAVRNCIIRVPRQRYALSAFIYFYY